MRELLQSLLDSLDAGPLDGMVTADQVLDRTALLVAVRNATDAELTRTVRRGETMQAAERDGLTSMRSWLRGHLRLSAREAARIVGNGRALEQLPAVASAFAAGTVTAEQVSVIAPVAAVDVQAEAVGQGVDLAEIDATLAQVATTQVHAALGTVVQHFLTRLDPDGTEPDPMEQRACRSPGTTTAASVAASSSTRSAGRRSARCWSRWCRRTGRPVTCGPVPSSWGMRWSNGRTTLWRRARCRSFAQ